MDDNIQDLSDPNPKPIISGLTEDEQALYKVLDEDIKDEQEGSDDEWWIQFWWLFETLQHQGMTAKRFRRALRGLEQKKIVTLDRKQTQATIRIRS